MSHFLGHRNLKCPNILENEIYNVPFFGTYKFSMSPFFGTYKFSMSHFLGHINLQCLKFTMSHFLGHINLQCLKFTMSHFLGHWNLQFSIFWDIEIYNVPFFGTYKFDRSLEIFYSSAGVVYLLNNLYKRDWNFIKLFIK